MRPVAPLVLTLLAVVLGLLAVLQVLLAVVLPSWSVFWIVAAVAAGGALVTGVLAVRRTRQRAAQERYLDGLGERLPERRRDPLRWLP